ncbi:unnamed protein product [Penicillium manginii]
MTDPNMRGTPPAHHPDSNLNASTSSSTPNPTPGQSTRAGTSAANNKNANPPSQPSLATRIQSSATSLARSALTGPSDYAQTLNTATQGKAAPGPSSGPTSASASANYTTPQTNNAPSSQQQPTPAPTFRTTPTTNPRGAFSIPNITEEEFQRVYTDTGTYGRAYYEETGPTTALKPNESLNAGTGAGADADASQTSLDDLQSHTGPWKGKHRLQDPVQLEYTTAWERASPHKTYNTYTDTYTPVSTDGDAVTALLADPSFDAANDDAENYHLDLELDTELAPLSNEEVEMLESFRREFGVSRSGSGSGRALPQGSVGLSSVSLVPDIDAFLNEHDGSGVSLRDSVLAELPGSGEWVGVQERYHDEVWGYLRPALEAAREEIEEAKGGGGEGVGHGDGDGPAVRRLKMILKHMGTRSIYLGR